MARVKVKKILCPVDFSKVSHRAFDYSVAMAKNFKGKIILLHVVESFMTDSYVAFDPEIGAQVITTMEEKAQKLLNKLAKKMEPKKITTKIVKGRPFVEIIREARESNVDLIVVGTHGMSALSNLLIGSNAEKVVRKAPCPVLTIKGDEQDFVHP